MLREIVYISFFLISPRVYALYKSINTWRTRISLFILFLHSKVTEINYLNLYTVGHAIASTLERHSLSPLQAFFHLAVVKPNAPSFTNPHTAIYPSSHWAPMRLFCVSYGAWHSQPDAMDICYCSPSWTANLLRRSLTTFGTGTMMTQKKKCVGISEAVTYY